MATKYWYNLDAMLIGALRLKPIEMIVFRWLIGFMHSGAMQNFEKGPAKYYWVSLPKLVADLNFTTLKTEQYARRILQSLCTKKVLYYALQDNNKSFYALTKNGADLVKHFKERYRRQITGPVDHRQTHHTGRRVAKPDAEMPATILKRIMPNFAP